MSLSVRIIPCLDVDNGRVVKGTNFVDLVDAGDPIELAKRYDLEGADELVFLDITASSDKRNILKELVAKTANQLFIPFTVGGGISDIETIHQCLLAGSDKVSINTAAIFNPDLIHQASQRFGAQCIVVAIDARKIQSHPQQIDRPAPIALDSKSRWEIFTHGGRNPTGIDAIKWAQHMAQLGAGELLVTSMDKDGTQSGYDCELLFEICNRVTIPVIASGGAGNCEHIAEALQICDAALLASLLHFRQLSIAQIKTHCEQQQLPIRHT